MTEIQHASIPFHFFRLPEVLAAVGVGKSTLYDWIRQGRFPKPVQLSSTASVWVSTEVAEWMVARVAGRDSPSALAA